MIHKSQFKFHNLDLIKLSNNNQFVKVKVSDTSIFVYYKK